MSAAPPAANGREPGWIGGYASLFGRLDQAGDRVEAGAFARSLRERGANGIRMLWQHDPGEPIGVWTRLTEDARGLWAEGRVSLRTRRGRDAFELLDAGAVDGLSIGFRTRRDQPVSRSGALRRRLLDIDLWEISLVTFPMQDAARVVRSHRLSRDLFDRFAAAARRMGPRPALPVRA